MLKNIKYISFFIMLLCIEVSAAEFTDYLDFYNGIKSLEVNQQEAYEVKQLVFEKDAGTMTLSNGTLYFMEDFGGQKHFAVFLGEGKFSFVPNVKAEQENLKRIFDTDRIDYNFTKASFVFDNDFYQLAKKQGVKLQYVEDIKYIKRVYYDTYKHYMHTKTKEIYYGLAYSLLDDKSSDFFYAQFFRENKNHYVWIYDPYAMEENRLFIAEEGMSDDFDRISSVIEFESSEDQLLNSDLRAHKKAQLITGLSYDVDFKMTSSVEYKSTSTYTFQAEEDFSWLKLDIFNLVHVLSVVDEEGKPIYFYYTDYPFEKVLWLHFDKKIRKGDKRSITFTIAANVRNRSFLAGYNLYPIYPKDELLNFSLNAEADLTKEIHAFGKKLEEKSDRLRGKRQTVWQYTRPLYSIGILRWNFKEQNLEFEKQPKEFTLKYQHVNFTDEVLDNYRNGLQYFNNIFGKLDYKKVVLYELPYYTSIDSISGLLNNSDDTANQGDWILASEKKIDNTSTPFDKTRLFEERLQYLTRNSLYKQSKYSDNPFDALMIASDYPNMEVLPPYYFNRKSPTIFSEFIARLSSMWLYDHRVKSYRDSWIETGLPMYLGMVYYYTYYKDKDRFFRLLRDIEYAFLSYSDGISKSYSDLGPLSLGVRAENIYKTSTLKTNGLKSVFIFHMLRNMFMDYTKGMNEDMFLGMMRDYYHQFKGQKYSTDDFRQLLEKHCGYSLKWFFDQWVDGTDIPTYKFASKVENMKDGKYLVKCKLAQEDVAKSFKMFVPIKVTFDDDSFYIQRVLMQGNETEFNIGPFDEEPDDIEFNPFTSVLCNVDNVSY